VSSIPEAILFNLIHDLFEEWFLMFLMFVFMRGCSWNTEVEFIAVLVFLAVSMGSAFSSLGWGTWDAEVELIAMMSIITISLRIALSSSCGGAWNAEMELITVVVILAISVWLALCALEGSPLDAVVELIALVPGLAVSVRLAPVDLVFLDHGVAASAVVELIASNFLTMVLLSGAAVGSRVALVSAGGELGLNAPLELVAPEAVRAVSEFLLGILRGSTSLGLVGKGSRLLDAHVELVAAETLGAGLVSIASHDVLKVVSTRGGGKANKGKGWDSCGKLLHWIQIVNIIIWEWILPYI